MCKGNASPIAAGDCCDTEAKLPDLLHERSRITLPPQFPGELFGSDHLIAETGKYHAAIVFSVGYLFNLNC